MRREASLAMALSLVLAFSLDGVMAGPSKVICFEKQIHALSQPLNDLLGKPARHMDGEGNNLQHPNWGRAGSAMTRLTFPAYADGSTEPSGGDRPGPRNISNRVLAQDKMMWNEEGVSDLFWQWGQFLDHDLTLTPSLEPFEPFDIPVPSGDAYFDPETLGNQVIHLERSFYHMVDGVREQVNINTAFIDTSQVYGSDEARALELRTLDGTGRLKSTPGDYLPFNTNGFFNFPFDDDPSFFLAGDVRVNEQVGLTAMHTLFMREHNLLAGHLRELFPEAEGEHIYQLARRIVGAEMQCITHKEFLPLLLGSKALPPYRGYNPDVHPGIMNEFATAAYRVGHTLLSPFLQRLQQDGQPVPGGPLPLRQAFFNPEEFLLGGGVAPLLRGLASQTAQQVDVYVIDDIRNFLFGPPGAGGFDLASLNIQRARDHGLPSYNQVRVALGLEPRLSFAEISSSPEIQLRLVGSYPSVDKVDLWVGGLAEDHLKHAMVGETFHTILAEQFFRLREGDRFWFEHDLPPALVAFVNQQSLADIIRRNSRVGAEFPNKAMERPFLP